MGLVQMRHGSHLLTTQSSHSMDGAWWQAKWLVLSLETMMECAPAVLTQIAATPSTFSRLRKF